MALVCRSDRENQFAVLIETRKASGTALKEPHVLRYVCVCHHDCTSLWCFQSLPLHTGVCWPAMYHLPLGLAREHKEPRPATWDSRALGPWGTGQ